VFYVRLLHRHDDPNQAAAMAEDSTGQSELRRMRHCFGSVGLSRFDVTWTDSEGQSRRWRKGDSLNDAAQPRRHQTRRLLDAGGTAS
jgi:hypothetical protein